METKTSMIFYTCGFKYKTGFEQLRKRYPPDTPVAVVCYAGVPNQEMIVRSTVGKFLEEVEYEKLPYLNILLVGKFLTVGQARTDGVMSGKSMIDIIHGAADDHSEGPPAATTTKPATTAKPGSDATGMRTECAGNK